MRRLGIAMVATTAACSLLTSFEGFDHPKGAAVTDAGAAGDAAPEDTCFRRRWPAPPAGGSSADLGPMVAALSSMKTINETGFPYGFDLDGLCSCPEKVACLGSKPNLPCDPTDSGIDNVASDLFFFFSKATKTSLDESGLRLGLDRGKFSVLFRLAGWNGEPDDPDVSLQVLNAFDANPGTDAGARFDGNDQWIVDTASLVSGIPVQPVTKAYVAGGKLVAEMPTLTFKARIPTVGDKWLLIRVVLRDVHLTATIAKKGASFTLSDGELGGRSPSAELFTLAMYLGACPGGVAFDSMKPILCDARDLPIDPAKDGRDFPCDAISVGVAFEASPAAVAPGDAGTPDDPFPCVDASLPYDCQ